MMAFDGGDSSRSGHNSNTPARRSLPLPAPLHALCRGLMLATTTVATITMATAAMANDTASQDELGELMALLQQETELATQTRMNADYVPGMVSVLYAEDALVSGKHTVADVLSDVAGFMVNETNSGDKRVIVRGVGATQNASNLKLMLDGVAVNRPTDGSADWLFRMPLTMVDRVEVIRGPGSSVHGGFAFSGVVNVIPRTENSVGAFSGSQQQRRLALNLSESTDAGVNTRLLASFWRKGNSGLETGPDNFRPSATHSPGRVYDHEQGAMMVAGIDWQGYRFDISMVSTERGPGHGESAALPYESDPRIEQSVAARLGKQWRLAEGVTLNSEFSYLNTGLNKALSLPLPAGITPPGRTQPLRNDVFRSSGSQDHAYALRTDLTWQWSDAHLLHGELSSQHLKVDSSYTLRSVNGENHEYIADGGDPVIEGSSRYVNAFGLQDQWQVTEALAITTGIRVDQYTDWGNHVSPRLAAVWQLDGGHILKLQYAEAFRPPSLEEANPGPDSNLAGSGSLNEEIIKSWEAAWVYRGDDERLSATVFRTKVQDLIEFYINPGRLPVWRNRGDIMTVGAELEWQQQVSRSLEWSGNLSYANAKDYFDPDQRLLGAVDWMANIKGRWYLSDGVSTNLNVRYIGQQEGWEVGRRVPHERRFPAYWLFDVSLEWRHAFAIDDLYMLASCQNLTDRQYRSVPSPSQYPEGLNNGYRQLGVGVKYEF